MTLEGVLGPRADGYVVANPMSANEAADYHAAQIAVFAAEGADRVCGVTLNYVDEAIGIVLAAKDSGVPCLVSFTVETDGRLPDGTALGEAIRAVDAATTGGAEFFMINCAHPRHVALGLGDPVTAVLARDHAALRELLPHVEVLGGCCGTDARHVREIVAAW